MVLNRFPYNAGHLLVAPKVHEGNIENLSQSVAAELIAMIQRSVRVVKAELSAHGVNVGANLGRASGAGVPDHLHVHIVPRWNGDTNFMPVLADVKVVSDSLDAMWNRLCLAFARDL